MKGGPTKPCKFGINCNKYKQNMCTYFHPPEHYQQYPQQPKFPQGGKKQYPPNTQNTQNPQMNPNQGDPFLQ